MGEERVEERSRSWFICLCRSLSPGTPAQAPAKALQRLRVCCYSQGRQSGLAHSSESSGASPGPGLSLHDSPLRGNGIMRNRGEPLRAALSASAPMEPSLGPGSEEGTIRQREVLGNEKDGSQNKHLLKES